MTCQYDVIIIGVGPSGISCGIEAQRAGHSSLLIEQGGIADAIRRFPTEMHFYSTAEMLTLAGIPFTCQGTRPTRTEALRYYRLICEYFNLPLELHTHISNASRVESGFQLRSRCGKEFTSRNLILATGYFDTPIRLDIPGEDLPHVSHFYTEPYAYSGSSVLIVGGGNSAVDAALDLYRNGAKVTLVHRGKDLSSGIKYWTLPDFQNRVRDGAIRVLFEHTLSSIDENSATLENRASRQSLIIPAQAVFLLTGYRASLELLLQLGADCNFNRGEPIHDGHYQTSVPGLFCAGSANCGIHTSEIFIENGRTHAASIIPALR